jgi:hypothetical protein
MLEVSIREKNTEVFYKQNYSKFILPISKPTSLDLSLDSSYSSSSESDDEINKIDQKLIIVIEDILYIFNEKLDYSNTIKREFNYPCRNQEILQFNLINIIIKNSNDFYIFLSSSCNQITFSLELTKLEVKMEMNDLIALINNAKNQKQGANFFFSDEQFNNLGSVVYVNEPILIYKNVLITLMSIQEPNFSGFTVYYNNPLKNYKTANINPIMNILSKDDLQRIVINNKDFNLSPYDHQRQSTYIAPKYKPNYCNYETLDHENIKLQIDNLKQLKIITFQSFINFMGSNLDETCRQNRIIKSKNLQSKKNQEIKEEEEKKENKFYNWVNDVFKKMDI